MREYSIRYGKFKCRQQREYEVKLVEDISDCCDKSLISDIDKSNVITLQAKLDNLYIKKAQGAYIYDLGLNG